MNKSNFHIIRMLLAIALLTAAVLPMQADYSKSQPGRNTRYNRHGSDVCVIEINQQGSVEQYFTRHDMEAVRLLVVNGPITRDDIKFIKKIANRSHAYADEQHSKKVDNYLDVDLSHAVMMNNKELFGSMNGCDHLRSIILPEFTRRIESNALSGCRNLEEVIMPSDVRIIGDAAFDDCTHLQDIYLENSIQEIGNRAFNGCKRIKSLFLPRDLKRIGDQAFSGTGLREIQLPDNLKEMSGNAFAGTDISQIEIPAGCSIKGSFNEMSALQYIEVESGSRYYRSDNGLLMNLDGTALLCCPPALKGTMALKDGIQVIADKAFMGCHGLTAIELAESITAVGEDAFNGCSGLQAIEFKAPASFGKNAFANCTSLLDFDFGGDIAGALPMGLFEGCTRLQEITLPDNVRAIPRYCFRGCSMLGDIDLPEGLSVIERGAFKGTALTSVELPASVAAIEKDAYNECRRLVEFTAGTGLTTIGEEAFNNCESLARVTLNEGLATIESKAFNNCALTTLTIPGTVSHIGKNIVDKNKGLTSITCLAPLPPKLDKASNDKVQLLVPAASVNSYKQAKNWKNYRNIAPIE